MQREDCDCPVCFTILVEPVVTPCKHHLCIQCTRAILPTTNKCPLCRTPFAKDYKPKVDKDLQKFVSQIADSEWKQRKSELVKDGKWVGDRVSLAFSFGNSYKRIKNP